MDGWQTLERIRELSDVPVLMLTAKDAETDRVRGLRAGADDYVTKPFAREELLARVHALSASIAGGASEPGAYSDGLLEVDFVQRTVSVHGREAR